MKRNTERMEHINNLPGEEKGTNHLNHFLLPFKQLEDGAHDPEMCHAQQVV